MKEHHAPTRLLLQAWDGHIIWSQSGLVRRSRVIADGRKLTKPLLHYDLWSFCNFMVCFSYVLC